MTDPHTGTLPNGLAIKWLGGSSPRIIPWFPSHKEWPQWLEHSERKWFSLAHWSYQPWVWTRLISYECFVYFVDYIARVWKCMKRMIRVKCQMITLASMFLNALMGADCIYQIGVWHINIYLHVHSKSRCFYALVCIPLSCGKQGRIFMDCVWKLA